MDTTDKIDTGNTSAVVVSLLRCRYRMEYITMMESFMHYIMEEGGVKPDSREWQLAADAFSNGFAGGLAFGTGMTMEDVENTEE